VEPAPRDGVGLVQSGLSGGGTTVRTRCCRNVQLQEGLRPRLLLGPSAAHELGVFAGEEVAEGAFVGEYTGEVLSLTEARSRGRTYDAADVLPLPDDQDCGPRRHVLWKSHQVHQPQRCVFELGSEATKRLRRHSSGLFCYKCAASRGGAIFPLWVHCQRVACMNFIFFLFCVLLYHLFARSMSTGAHRGKRVNLRCAAHLVLLSRVGQSPRRLSAISQR